jgi:hypothetical protein
MTAPKWYQHTAPILSSAFQKPYFKRKRFKRILFKAKDVFGFKIFVQISYLVLVKRFHKPKALPKKNKLLFGVKIAAKKKGF